MVETVRVELAVPLEDRVTLVGLRETVGPMGEMEAARLTIPAKLLILVTVTADVLEDPCITLIEAELDASVNP